MSTRRLCSSLSRISTLTFKNWFFHPKPGTKHLQSPVSSLFVETLDIITCFLLLVPELWERSETCTEAERVPSAPWWQLAEAPWGRLWSQAALALKGSQPRSATWSRASFLTFLSLSYLVCKPGITPPNTPHRVVEKIQWYNQKHVILYLAHCKYHSSIVKHLVRPHYTRKALFWLPGTEQQMQQKPPTWGLHKYNVR